jgi:hypothetical protein
MSHGVAVNTRIAGAAQGNFLDDLTTRMSFPTSDLRRSAITLASYILVGQWPRPNAILRITNVVVNVGAVIDSVKITYNTSSGSQTVTHGGSGGKEGLNFSLTGKFICFVFKICSPGITANQTITAVYGRRLNSSTPYGSRKCVAYGLDDIVDTVSFKLKWFRHSV